MHSLFFHDCEHLGEGASVDQPLRVEILDGDGDGGHVLLLLRENDHTPRVVLRVHIGGKNLDHRCGGYPNVEKHVGIVPRTITMHIPALFDHETTNETIVTYPSEVYPLDVRRLLLLDLLGYVETNAILAANAPAVNLLQGRQQREEKYRFGYACICQRFIACSWPMQIKIPHYLPLTFYRMNSRWPTIVSAGITKINIFWGLKVC